MIQSICRCDPHPRQSGKRVSRLIPGLSIEFGSLFLLKERAKRRFFIKKNSNIKNQSQTYTIVPKYERSEVIVRWVEFYIWHLSLIVFQALDLAIWRWPLKSDRMNVQTKKRNSWKCAFCVILLSNLFLCYLSKIMQSQKAITQTGNNIPTNLRLIWQQKDFFQLGENKIAIDLKPYTKWKSHQWINILIKHPAKWNEVEKWSEWREMKNKSNN